MGINHSCRVCFEICTRHYEYSWPHQVCPSEQIGLHLLLDVDIDGICVHWLLALSTLSCHRLEQEVDRRLKWYVCVQLITILGEEERVLASCIICEPCAHDFTHSQLISIIIKIFIVKNIISE